MWSAYLSHVIVYIIESRKSVGMIAVCALQDCNIVGLKLLEVVGLLSLEEFQK